MSGESSSPGPRAGIPPLAGPVTASVGILCVFDPATWQGRLWCAVDHYQATLDLVEMLDWLRAVPDRQNPRDGTCADRPG